MESPRYTRRMRRFLLGILTGSLVTIAVMGTAGDWYEYYLADGSDVVEIRINHQGWQIVPNQANPRYLRRPILHLH